ncbi:MAG: LacI family DNA-binding transcriptional regulator [Eubacteriales bacterium]|nr:LacI family DNA-binding transcriptional regulator [Eubacteriales bacterium]
MGKRKKVTTRDIAEALEISQSTVSMILSGKPNVSFTEDTILRVKEAARKMGYQKSSAKTAKKEKALADSIIVICPKLSGGYYSMMLHSIMKQAKKYHYTVFTVTTFREAEAEDCYLDMLEKSRLAGVISLYPVSKIQKMNALSRQVPVISVGDKPAACKFDSVELDSKKPGYLIGNHLISLGHTHITYISTPIRQKEIGRLHRLEGVKMSFQDHGYPLDQIEILYQTQSAFEQYPTEHAEYQNAYDLTLKALKQKTPSTAFVGNNDIAAFGIMGALADQGFKIPSDYSVCGFDNIALASMPQISLTTVEHASVQKGEEAVDMIYRKNSQSQSNGQPNYIIRLEYEPQLIVRGSTGRCKDR